MFAKSLVNRFQQSEYTGENRCIPCTLVNVVIALALAVAIALLWPPAGVLALVVFFGTIYLRGYLVPGTPELTQKYFPKWLLVLFGKDPLEVQPRTPNEGVTRSASVNADEHGEQAEPVKVERLLSTAGIVEECENEDDHCLTEEFGEVWWRRIRQLRTDEERVTTQLAAIIDVDPEGLSFDDNEDVFCVTYEGDLIAEWPSDAAFYADLAAEPTLAEWLADWEELSDRQRTELLAGTRAFLENCPACDADLESVENLRKSCCAGEMVDVSITCDDCGARVFNGTYT